MTGCFRATRYREGGGDLEWNFDYPPYGTTRVWDETDQLWTADLETGIWTADGVTDSAELEWELLLQDHGPLYDTPPPGVTS